MKTVEVIDTDADNISQYGFCGYKNIKQEGYRRKIEWLQQRFSEGMKFKVLFSAEQGSVGCIEYVPGEYNWRGVEAAGYMVIHCIVIMKRDYKGKGHGSLLVEECLRDAKRERMRGVAVVTSTGTWMAGKELFLKKGFEEVDAAPPGFELVVKKLKKGAAAPKFKGDWQERLKPYSKGLTIVGSDQCPYIVKSVKEIGEAARTQYGLKARVIELSDCEQAQNAPCAYGVFSLVYDGVLIADHPISRTRFSNIMNKLFG